MKATADRFLSALQECTEALAHYRAAELGVVVDNLALNDVLVSEDERALIRLTVKAARDAGLRVTVGTDDTIDHVIARLAAERGWNIVDAARAILGDADAPVDVIRNQAPHAKARRVRASVHRAIDGQLTIIEDQLAALRKGTRPMDAAPSVVAAAVLSFFTGREVTLEALITGLETEQARLRGVRGRRQG